MNQGLQLIKCRLADNGRLIDMIHSLDKIRKNMKMFESLDSTIVDLMSSSSDSKKGVEIGYRLIGLTCKLLELDKRISKLERD